MENELNLKEFLRVANKWKGFIISFTAAVVILTMIICIIVPPTYRTKTTLLIPSQGKGLEGVLELSSLLSESSGNTSSNLSSDMTQSLLGRTTNFSDILKSHTLAGMIVDGAGLQNYYHTKNKESIVRMVKAGINVKESKGILTITVDSKDPRLAAVIANYSAVALDEFNKKGNIHYARRLKIFIGEQLAASKVDLTDAEDNYKKFETQSQMVRMAQKELMVERLLRDVKVKEAIYTMLMQEYEKAKIEEAKEDLFFEVLDPAPVPKAPYKPKPLLYSLIAVVLGGMCSVFFAFLFEYLENIGVKIPQPEYGKEIKWPRTKGS